MYARSCMLIGNLVNQYTPWQELSVTTKTSFLRKYAQLVTARNYCCLHIIQKRSFVFTNCLV